jgi:hypothetical protein
MLDVVRLELDVERFAAEGYLVVPGVVPPSLLDAADEEIDGLLASEPPVEGTGGVGTNLWFPPVARLPRCDEVLRTSDAMALASSLVDPLALDHAFDHIQVATTVPPHPHVPGGPHIDGHGPGMDEPHSFTMLAGVLLTDQTGEQAGNLWVWPGSHLDHARLFRERGPTLLMAAGGHASPTALTTPRPVPVRGSRGDLLLAHYLLGHNKGGNTEPWERRTIYYRLAAAGHSARWASTFTDPWTEYEPLRALFIAAAMPADESAT